MEDDKKAYGEGNAWENLKKGLLGEEETEDQKIRKEVLKRKLQKARAWGQGEGGL